MNKQKLFTKNFSLLIFGQTSSLFGNAILSFALSMYILDKTGSASIFAGILAASTLPTILLSPFGGILADRGNRRNIMVTLDFLCGLTVLIGILTLSEHFFLPIVTLLLLVLSILEAFESPTVSACVPQMQSGENIIKANAVINQMGALSALLAPILGAALYSLVGLKPVMTITTLLFFLTAISECFIKLPHTKRKEKEPFMQMIKEDFSSSTRFLTKGQPQILNLLLLTAIVSFFIMGTATVGLPYIVRNILGLSANYYGAAVSAIGVAAIAGSIAAALLTQKLKFAKLYQMLVILGVALAPAGIAFLIPTVSITRYMILILSICIVQFAASIFSIFALSAIQQKTPEHMIGKIMAYTATISMCAQPLGQISYGLLFDLFHSNVYFVLLPTALIITLIGFLSRGVFRRLN